MGICLGREFERAALLRAIRARPARTVAVYGLAGIGRRTLIEAAASEPGIRLGPEQRVGSGTERTVRFVRGNSAEQSTRIVVPGSWHDVDGPDVVVTLTGLGISSSLELLRLALQPLGVDIRDPTLGTELSEIVGIVDGIPGLLRLAAREVAVRGSASVLDELRDLDRDREAPAWMRAYLSTVESAVADAPARVSTLVRRLSYSSTPVPISNAADTVVVLELIRRGLALRVDTRVGPACRLLAPLRWVFRKRMTDEEIDSERAALLERVQSAVDGFESRLVGNEHAETLEEIDGIRTDIELLVTTALPEHAEAIAALLARLWPYWNARSRSGFAREHLARLRSVGFSAKTRISSDFCDGYLGLIEGDLDGARLALQRIGEIEAGCEAELHSRRSGVLRGLVLLYAGDPVGSAAALRAGSRDEGEDTLYALLRESYLAVALALTGAYEEAFSRFAGVIDRCEEEGEHWIRGYTLWAFALCTWRLGRHSQARMLAIDGLLCAIDARDRHGQFVCLEVIAWCAAEAGDFSLAVACLAQVRRGRGSTGLSATYWGFEDDSANCLSKISDALGRIRTLRIIERDEQGLEDLVGQLISVDGRPSIRLSPLSTREEEIAILIAEGLSGRAIGERLFISIGTVNTHTEHIFEKLEVRSRAQVAAWVGRTLQL